MGKLYLQDPTHKIFYILARKGDFYMYNVLIWGTGQGYNQHFNLIKYFESKGEISVQGVMSNDKEIEHTLDGYKFYSKKQINDVEYDYCLVTIQNMASIYEEASQLGIGLQKLIPIRVLEIPYFNFQKYISLKTNGLSILSRNCWAGFCYHYLALEFQSPTINMFFDASDFNKFLAKLDYYLSLPVENAGLAYDENMKKNYPLGRLDDIFLHFNHFDDFDDAESAWERRKKRMCKNVVVISSAVEKEIAMEFTKLPFQHKLIFIPKGLNIQDRSCFPVNYSDNGDGNTIGMYINGTANGMLCMIDLLSFLCRMKYDRIS